MEKKMLRQSKKFRKKILREFQKILHERKRERRLQGDYCVYGRVNDGRRGEKALIQFFYA